MRNVDRIVQDASSSSLEQTDSVFQPVSLSADYIRSSAEQAAQRLRAAVKEVHYIALYGETAEIAVRPDDPKAFVASAAGATCWWASATHLRVLCVVWRTESVDQ